jgi:hypothetical protein
MIEDNKHPDAVEEVDALSWEDYVKLEVNTLLNTFLPYSSNGNVGIKYIHPVKVQYEGSEEYDDEKYSGVEIRLIFHFENVLKVKPDNTIEENIEE